MIIRLLEDYKMDHLVNKTGVKWIKLGKRTPWNRMLWKTGHKTANGTGKK